MPVNDSARSTPTAGAATLRDDSAIRADLRSTIRERFTVERAVTGFAQRQAIRNVEPQRGRGGPRLDMVSVQPTTRAAFLAPIPVTLIDGRAPRGELRAMPGAFALKRSSVYPGAGGRADARFHSAGTRTVHLRSAADERFAAGRADNGARRIAARPARLRAIPPDFLSGPGVGGAADDTHVGDMILSSHARSIPHHQLSPTYAAVALERLTLLGLSPRRAE
jgi:hypothetical protein